jgi:hypothetical protein
MSDDPKRDADQRLDAALAVDGAPRDPRPYFRPALRFLKERDAGAYDRALAHLDETLIPAVVGGADPLGAWLEYGMLLAELLGPGRTVAVDATGRAEPTADVAAAEGLVLHLSDIDDRPALVLRCPASLSPAQNATIELLVAGRVTASAYADD